MINDQLVLCLEKLLQTVSGEEDPEIFIDRVAEEYLMTLVRQAHIPIVYLNSLKDDVRTELHDLLRVRSYGCASLRDYFSQCAANLRRPLT